MFTYDKTFASQPFLCRPGGNAVLGSTVFMKLGIKGSNKFTINAKYKEPNEALPMVELSGNSISVTPAL